MPLPRFSLMVVATLCAASSAGAQDYPVKPIRVLTSGMGVLNRPDVKEKFLNAGGEVVANAPEQLAAWLKSEIAKWGKGIKEAGIRAE